MSHAYESNFKNMSHLVSRYVDARVAADIDLSLAIELEISEYLASNTDLNARDEQQHLKGAFDGVMSQCDAQLGALGSLEIRVIDPIQ